MDRSSFAPTRTAIATVCSRNRRAQPTPDGLPVGVSKTVISKPAWKGAATGEFAGVTCAMCHESELHYQGKRVRIDGGNNHTLDFQGYIVALDAAMQTTLKDPAKFDRLASRLNAMNGEAKTQLRARFELQGSADPLLRDALAAFSLTVGPRAPRRAHDDQNRMTRESARDSREYVYAQRTRQAAVPVEQSAGPVDAVGRNRL